MLFVVCSNKFDAYLGKWLGFAASNPGLSFVFINDAGIPGREIAPAARLPNVRAIDNGKNMGKVRSLFAFVLSENVSDWIFCVDDKGKFLVDGARLLEISQTPLDPETLYVADNADARGKTLGDAFPDDGSSLGEFYFARGRVGDKFLLWHSGRLLENRARVAEFMNFSGHVFETALLSFYYDLKTRKFPDVLIEYAYARDGITANNLANKLKNPEYYVWEQHYVLRRGPCLSQRIVRLFLLWHLRRSGGGAAGLDPVDRFLYAALRATFAFRAVKALYVRRLRRLVAG